MKIFVCFALSAILLLPCCKESTSEVAEAEDLEVEVAVNIRGEWSDDESHYRNDYFGIELDVPESWSIERGSNKKVNQRASKILAGDDDNLKAVFDEAIEKTYTVFSASRYPIGTPGKRNVNAAAVIENVGAFPGIETGGDYLLVMEDTLKMSKTSIVFVDEPKEVSVGGINFWTRSSEISMGNIKIQQQYYCVKKGEHVFLYATTVMSDGDREVVKELTDTIKKP